MNILEQKEIKMDDLGSSILTESPQVRAIWEQLEADRRDSEKNKPVKETVLTEKKQRVQTRTSKELENLIIQKENEIKQKQELIDKKIKAAQESLDGSPAEFAKVIRNTELELRPILLKEDNVKFAKEKLIEFYKNEIKQYELDLANNNFNVDFTTETANKIAEIIANGERKREIVYKNWVQWAHDQINWIVEGNYPDNVKGKIGLRIQKQNLENELKSLQFALEEAKTREALTPQQKDVGNVSKMVDTIMSADMPEHMNKKQIAEVKSELAELMEETDNDDELDNLLK